MGRKNSMTKTQECKLYATFGREHIDWYNQNALG